MDRAAGRLAGSWDQRRQMLTLTQETIAFRRDRGPAVRAHLITNVVPLAQAQPAYDALDAGRPNGVQVGLDAAGASAASPPAPSS